MAFKYDPIDLMIHLTPLCNNRCSFCYVNSESQAKAPSELLSVEEMKQIIRDFSSVSSYYAESLKDPEYWWRPNVTFNGGEPTVRYAELLTVLNFVKEEFPQYLSAVITNGGLLGATGEYREAHKKILQKAGLYDLSPDEAVRELVNTNLYGLYLSVDDGHNSLDEIVEGKVPIQVLRSFLRSLFKTDFVENKKLILNTVSSPQMRLRNQEILSRLMVGFSEESYTVFCDERGITRRNISIQQTDSSDTISSPLTLDEILKFQCRRHSKPAARLLTDYWRNELVVFWDGEVYFCNGLSFSLGNIREDSIIKIVQRVEERDISHSVYGKNVEIVNIMPDLSTEHPEDNCCLGIMLKLLEPYSPELVRARTDEPSTCRLLGRDERLKDVLIKEFYSHQEELLDEIKKREADGITRRIIERFKRFDEIEAKRNRMRNRRI